MDRRTTAGCEIEAALHELGEPVGPAVTLRMAFVEAATAGSWVGAHAPRTAGHIEIAVLAAVVNRLAVAETPVEAVLRTDDRLSLRFFPFPPSAEIERGLAARPDGLRQEGVHAARCCRRQLARRIAAGAHRGSAAVCCAGCRTRAPHRDRSPA